ncbi:hypothetical protein Tco_0425989 [Tanacetum coccineum]
MANIRTCNKHNMIACVEKTAHNADFYQIIDYLTGCSINYSLLVDPDLIGPWLQQFWATASLRVINEVPHIRAMVAGKRVLISEETIRADLLFDDADVLIFPKQVICGIGSEDIGYEIHHGIILGGGETNTASALVGLATNQKFNFSLMIMNGMLGHISNGKPFLMYPRFIQLFLNKQLEGVTRPQNFIPSVTLPSKVFTFMRKHSPKFSCRITPLTPPMLEIVTALAAEEAHSTSPHSRAASSPRDAQGTPDQSAAQASISQGTAEVQGTDNSQGTAEVQGTADFQGTAETQGAANIPKSPNDYTPTDASQTSGGDEGLLDIYALNREVRRLKKQTLSQAKQIRKLKAKLKKLSKVVEPVVKHHAFWVESQNLKKQKRRRKKQRKKVSSVKLGRNNDEGNLSEEHHDQDDDLETTNDDGFAKKILRQNGMQKERKRLEAVKKPKTILKKPTSLVQERNQMMSFLKGQGYKNLQKLKYPQMKELYDKVQESIKDSFKEFIPMDSEKEKQMLQERDAKRLLRKRKVTVTEEQPSKKLKLRTETIDELRNYLRIVDFEKSAQDRESLEAISMITDFKVIDSPDGEYLMIYRANTHFRAFDTLWEILHILDRQDLHHLYLVTSATSNDDFWKNQEDWEIVRWRLNESSRVHTLELEVVQYDTYVGRTKICDEAKGGFGKRRRMILLTSPEQTATGKDMTNPPPWSLPFLVAVEDLIQDE